MEKSIADLAKIADQMGLELPNIDQALQALESSDIDQFLKNLSVAGEDLKNMADLAEAMRNLQMQIAEVGKTLGEQLEKGLLPHPFHVSHLHVSHLLSTCHRCASSSARTGWCGGLTISTTPLTRSSRR